MVTIGILLALIGLVSLVFSKFVPTKSVSTKYLFIGLGCLALGATLLIYAIWAMSWLILGVGVLVLVAYYSFRSRKP